MKAACEDPGLDTSVGSEDSTAHVSWLPRLVPVQGNQLLFRVTLYEAVEERGIFPSKGKCPSFFVSHNDLRLTSSLTGEKTCSEGVPAPSTHAEEMDSVQISEWKVSLKP